MLNLNAKKEGDKENEMLKMQNIDLLRQLEQSNNYSQQLIE